MVARTGKAVIAGVMGFPVEHSMSPALHEFWLKKYAIDGAYIPMKVAPDNLENAIKSLNILGIKGCNLTLPHKEMAVNIVDSLDKQAEAIGAVNTIIIDDDGKIHGRNSDGYGFVQNLKQYAKHWKPTGCKTMVIGAGGAAKAVIAGLIEAGCTDFVITNRTKSKAEDIREHIIKSLGSYYTELQIEIVDWNIYNDAINSDINLLVNTTQLGMMGQPALDIQIDKLSKNAIVTDIVYNPLKTNLILQAEALGGCAVDGLGMLLWQAQAGFEAWFGVRPDIDDELREYILTLMDL